MELTVAEVSGMIAAAVFFLQLLLPLAIPWILIAFLSEENSVITWTVLGRFLHSSLWPTILGTSTAASEGVRWRVYLTTWLQTIALGVISVASICAPLGLFLSIERSENPLELPFGYYRDDSAFGYGTPSRNMAPFTRTCGPDLACPGSWLNESCERKGLLDVCNSNYEPRIPGPLMELYNDGARTFSPTVSSIFDIQYRLYRNSTDWHSIIEWYNLPLYRSIAVLLLEDEIKTVEGLVVDLERGGIGFRNHTGPTHELKYGSRWNEDLLFIEPETVCVPLNISLDTSVSLADDVGYSHKNLSITDHGGFSGLSRTDPGVRRSPSENGQEGFDLRDRAYKAAWINNFLTMVYLNLTDPDQANITRVDSELGRKFAIPDRANYSVSYENIRTTIDFGDYLDLDTTDKNRTHNPFAISKDEFYSAVTTCGGTSGSSTPNINTTLIGCGLVFGAASRTDGGSDLVMDQGSNWTTPLYSCASAIKATVKTAEFKFNGTGFGALAVDFIKPKEYPDPSAIPVWGVESVPGQYMEYVQPMWGIVGPNLTGHETTLHNYNITTFTGESLYLPGYLNYGYATANGFATVALTRSQNLPGVQFFNQVLMVAYNIDRPASQPYADYSGTTSRALYAKWQRLSKSADDVASIINLVWTDASANAVVGTKGWGLESPQSSMAIPSKSSITETKRATVGDGMDPIPTVPVFPYESHIRYRIVFAIPAFVVLGVTTAIIGTLIVLLVMRKTGLRRLREFLESTSMGRILWPLVKPGEVEREMDGSKRWVDTVGDRKVTITMDSIIMDAAVIEMENRRLLQDQDQDGGKDNPVKI